MDASYLRADYSLMCNTREHNMYKVYASVMILVSRAAQPGVCRGGGCLPSKRRRAPHRTALHCTASHCTASHCIAPHRTALHRIALHCTAPHYTAPHRTALHCTAPHRIAPHRPRKVVGINFGVLG